MTTIGGQILCCDPKGTCSIQSGVLRIDGERIVEVCFGEIPKSVDIGDVQTLITPGLIDTHLHLPQFDSIGVFGMPLLRWLNEVIFPAEARWNDIDFARSMIDRVIEQCLSVGTTGVCAYATVSHHATMAALEMFRDVGLRGVIGQVMMDRGAPAELIVSSRRLVDQVDATLHAFPASGRLAAAVTPRFALSCSEELLCAAGRLANEHQCLVQTHLAETQQECEDVSRQFGGLAYAEVYQKSELLGERSLLGHGIHLDRSSAELLAESNSVIAHCPTANSFLGSGIMDRYDHLERGVRISLGSDIGAGFERSMVRVGRAMIEAAIGIQFRRSGEVDFATVPSAKQAWYQITAGNAKAAGWSEAGMIKAGMPADLVVIQPTIPWNSTNCPLSTVMFAWDDRWIQQTILRGKTAYLRDH